MVRILLMNVGRTSILTLTIASVIGFGCSSPNVNPAKPKPHTGYADFYTDSEEDLRWDVAQFDAAANEFKPVYSRMKPGESETLRLAFAPGQHQIRISFLNRAITEPAIVMVEIQESRVTPVRIELAVVGQGSVQSKSTSVGGTLYGRYGRRTKFNTSDIELLRVIASPQPPELFQTREDMPYARKR
jgi:hypothetical protein